MTFKTADRVFETSVTTGTGTYTLDGAQTGFQAFSVFTAADVVEYFATDDINWEVGLGTYATGPARLERTTILASSNGGSAVNWGAGTRKIRCGMPAVMSKPRILSKSVAGSSNVTLTQDEQRRKILVLTGVLTGNIDLIVDATVWDWIVYNNTSGAYTLTMKVSGQTGVRVPQKRALALHCDGVDVVRYGDAAGVEARSSNTILGAADFGRTLNCTSTFTQTFTAAATLGDGWFCRIRNNGSGIITLDPDSTETIDGGTTMPLYPGDSCIVVCNGAVFVTVGAQGGRFKVGSFTRDISSASGNVAYTGVGFKPKAVIFFTSVNGGVGNASMGLDDGTSRLASSDNYNATPNTWGASSASSIYIIAGAVDNQTGYVSSFDADGFTVTWTKGGTPGAATAQINYLAMR